jgi:hypothetical protein
MEIGNTRDIDTAIRNAWPLSLMAGQRPEFADVERIWETELAPELGAREAIRKQTISRAKSRTLMGVLAALPVVIVMLFLSGGFGFFFPLSFFVGVIVVVGISGFDWLKVYSMKSQTKDLILKTACKPFGFRYETLHPDLSGIENFQSLKTRGKELMEAINGPQKGKERTISTVFGDIQVTLHDTAGAPAPTPAYQVLKDAALLPGHSQRKFEDLIEGERAGAKFALVEAKLDTGGKNSQTVFQGILIHIEYPQRFSGRTLMARSGWWKRLMCECRQHRRPCQSSGMTDLSDFFSHAWQTIGRAIAMAGIRAGLREVPETISKTVKRRCQAELKRLGILLRRLIFLMALHVQLAPVKPRLGSYYFEQTEGRSRFSLRTSCWAHHRANARPDRH